MARRESVASAATAAVTNVNDAPTGTVTISGTAPEDQVLTASNTLADADGLGAISYQWQRDGGQHRRGAPARPTRWAMPTSATPSMWWRSYTDGHGTAESRGQRGDVGGHQRQRCADRVGDDQRHGAAEDQVLTASNTLADADGLGAISYQWQRDGVNVAGATGTTYTLGNADVGHTIDVVAKLHRWPWHGGERGQRGDAAVTNVNDARPGR